MQTKVTYLLRAISISLRKINLNLATKLNQRNLAPKLNQSQSCSGAQSHRSELNVCISPSLSSISAQSRFNRGPSNSDTTRTATIKLPRHKKKAVHISPIRLAHSPDSLHSQFQSAHGLASSAVSLRSIMILILKKKGCPRNTTARPISPNSNRMWPPRRK